MKKYTEYNLATWLGMVKFMALNISECDFKTSATESMIENIIKINEEWNLNLAKIKFPQRFFFCRVTIAYFCRLQPNA